MHTFIYIVDLGKKMINLFLNIPQLYIGALLVLRNAIRGGAVEGFKCPGKSVTKGYRSMLLAIRRDGWVYNFFKKGA